MECDRRMEWWNYRQGKSNKALLFHSRAIKKHKSAYCIYPDIRFIILLAEEVSILRNQISRQLHFLTKCLNSTFSTEKFTNIVYLVVTHKTHSTYLYQNQNQNSLLVTHQLTYIYFLPGSVVQSDACLTGDLEVANSRLWSGTILLLRLIMKSFLWSFSPFCWFKKGRCQLLAKECALSTC